MRRRGLLAAAALVLVVAAAWVAERQLDGGGTSGDGTKPPAYTVAVTRDGELLRAFSVAELEALPAVGITADGKPQEGPSLLAVLEAAGVRDGFTEVEITGMGLRDGGHLVLAAGQVSGQVLLDFAERGTVKIVSPALSWRERVRDVVEIAVR